MVQQRVVGVCAQARGLVASDQTHALHAQVPEPTPAHLKDLGVEDDAVCVTLAPRDSALSRDVVFIYGTQPAFVQLFSRVRMCGMSCTDTDPVAALPVLDALLPAPDTRWSARLHSRLRTECPREAPLRAALCWLVDRALVGHVARPGALKAVRDCGYLCEHLGDHSMPVEAGVWDELDMAKKAAERCLYVRFEEGSGVAKHVCDRGLLLGLERVQWQCSGFAVYGQVQV